MPAVTSRIYGLIDAVEDGKSGILFPVRSVDSMMQAVLKLVDDGPLCREFGERALNRAVQEFPQQRLTDALIAFYGRLLKATGCA